MHLCKLVLSRSDFGSEDSDFSSLKKAALNELYLLNELELYLCCREKCSILFFSSTVFFMFNRAAFPSFSSCHVLSPIYAETEEILKASQTFKCII